MIKIKIPEEIKNKISVKLKLQNIIRELNEEIFDWFDEQGFDTQSLDFADSITSKLDYNEGSVEEIEKELNYFIKNGKWR